MKIKALAGVLAAALMAMAAGAVGGQEAVFVIRHAEKAAGADPALTEAGRARAAAWAGMLAQSGIAHVITSDARRSVETGGIVAARLGVESTALPIGDIAGMTDLLTFDFDEDRVLIVGHTETIPSILARLGHAGGAIMDRDDFASLFVLLPGDGVPALVRLAMP